MYPANTTNEDFTPLTLDTAVSLIENEISDAISDIASASNEGEVAIGRRRLNNARVLDFILRGVKPVETIGTTGETVAVQSIDTVISAP